MEDITTWFWNKSANKTDSDLENRQKWDKEPTLNKALSKTKEGVSIQNCPRR